MSKTTHINVKIDTENKEKAEKILYELDIAPSDAINMFYEQIILHNGLPFEIDTHSKNLDMSNVLKEELKSELEKDIHDIEHNRSEALEEVYDYFKKHIK